MSSVFMLPGDFSGWKQVHDQPGCTMAWNWPPFADLNFAKEPLFPAVAIGLYGDGNLTIRTPPQIAPVVVHGLIDLVMAKQAEGHPVAISLAKRTRQWDGVEGELALVLHATDPDQLEQWIEELFEALPDQ